MFAAICLCFQAPVPPAKEPGSEIKGMPPRAAPTDYQSHAKAGEYTIGAEYTGHSIVLPQGTLSTEDYIVIDTGFFGPADKHLKLNVGDFSLRVNGNKKALESQPYGVVLSSVKDPEWVPPEPVVKAKGGSILSSGGGGGGGDKPAAGDPPPPPPKPPFEYTRALTQRVAKAALPEGDRALPQAGLIFFRYTGNIAKIRSLELTYNGPAGSTAMRLQP